MDAEGDKADEILPMRQFLRRMPRATGLPLSVQLGFFPDRKPEGY